MTYKTSLQIRENCVYLNVWNEKGCKWKRITLDQYLKIANKKIWNSQYGTVTEGTAKTFFGTKEVKKMIKEEKEKLGLLLEKAKQFLAKTAKTVGAKKYRKAPKGSNYSSHYYAFPIYEVKGKFGLYRVSARKREDDLGCVQGAQQYQPLSEFFGEEKQTGYDYITELCIEMPQPKNDIEGAMLIDDEIAKRLLLLKNDEEMKEYVYTIGEVVESLEYSCCGMCGEEYEDLINLKKRKTKIAKKISIGCCQFICGDCYEDEKSAIHMW
jgi:hypothetical protein